MLGTIERYYEFGPFRLDAVERVLLCHGSPMPLTPKAFETLLTLVKHHGQVISKDDLIRWIWPDAVVEEATLSQNIFTVRTALRKGSSAAVIETVPKIGYRFVATARLLDVVTGRAMWAGVFNEHAPDLFAVLDSISSRITQGLLQRLDTTADDRPLDRIRELTRNWGPAQLERSYAQGK